VGKEKKDIQEEEENRENQKKRPKNLKIHTENYKQIQKIIKQILIFKN
tara:strand:- start:903 stop:1046 length:144 start_codon:yes stop_codon:yes gene_type:complete